MLVNHFNAVCKRSAITILHTTMLHVCACALQNGDVTVFPTGWVRELSLLMARMTLKLRIVAVNARNRSLKMQFQSVMPPIIGYWKLNGSPDH